MCKGIILPSKKQDIDRRYSENEKQVSDILPNGLKSPICITAGL